MITLFRSQIDSRWIEIREGDRLLQEVEVLFPLRKIPRSFSSEEEALRWLRETEQKQAKGRAYRLLAMRSYPSSILLKKLEEKGYSKQVSEKVVEELQQLGYVQDDDFWTQLIQREFQRGYGPRYIEWKKKAPAHRIKELITESMQRKKIREIRDKFPKKNVAQMLVRRGFDLDLIRKEIEIFS